MGFEGVGWGPEEGWYVLPYNNMLLYGNVRPQRVWFFSRFGHK